MKNYGKKSAPFIIMMGLLLGFVACQPKGEEPKEPVKPPQQIVTIDEAKGYYDNYSKRRVPLIQRYEDSINRRNMDPVDEKMQQDQKENNEKSAEAMQGPAKFDVARYVYYDYQTIKDYMTFIEQQATAAKVDISTLRFYFSNYPNDEKFIHPRQNSIMISPALKKGDREYLFYIDDSDPKNPTAVLLGDNFGPTKDGVGVAPSQSDQNFASFVPNMPNTSASTAPYYNGQSLTLNSGSGVPPPHNE